MPETIIIDNKEYSVHKKESGDILLKPIKKVIITKLNEMADYNFTFSKIISCKINDNICESNKYNYILKEIYNIIDSGTKIIKHSTLNIKTTKEEDDGFYYLDNIGISVQRVDANKCIYEIVNQSIKNKIKLEINIKLQNKDDIVIMI
jgi:hypothetical protein